MILLWPGRSLIEIWPKPQHKVKCPCSPTCEEAKFGVSLRMLKRYGETGKRKTIGHTNRYSKDATGRNSIRYLFAHGVIISGYMSPVLYWIPHCVIYSSMDTGHCCRHVWGCDDHVRDERMEMLQSTAPIFGPCPTLSNDFVLLDIVRAWSWHSLTDKQNICCPELRV